MYYAERRSVKKPTRTGMRINGRLVQHIPKPVKSAAIGSLLPPTSILAPGIKLMMANIAPINKVNKPGQPQNTVVTAVRIIAVVRFITNLLILI